MLETFREDPRIFTIAGTAFYTPAKKAELSYYLSKYVYVWGWATWRSTWLKHMELRARVPAIEPSEDELFEVLQNKEAAAFWHNLFKRSDVTPLIWDQEMVKSSFLTDSLSVVPTHNLISNIGFGPGATRTTDVNDPAARLRTSRVKGSIVHPSNLSWWSHADDEVYRRYFDPNRSPAFSEKLAYRIRSMRNRWYARFRDST